MAQHDKTANTLLSDPTSTKTALRRLKQDLKHLLADFNLWPISQPPEWRPRNIGFVHIEGDILPQDLEQMPAWPGKVLGYYDCKHYSTDTSVLVLL